MSIKSLLLKSRKEYRKIKYVECPAFDNEKVCFTNKGFNHLIRKGRIPRTPKEQIRRLKLLKDVTSIIKDAVCHSSYRRETTNSIVQFWSFEKKTRGKLIIVVICQIKNEPKHFISIMDKKLS